MKECEQWIHNMNLSIIEKKRSVIEEPEGLRNTC